MQYIPRWAGLLMVVAMVFPVFAADDKKDADKTPAAKDKADPKDKKDTKTEPKDKMVAAGQVKGKLVRVESAQKTLAIQISVPYPNGRSIGYKPVDLEYLVADDLQVLLAQAPVELDEKGKPKKLTANDLKKAVKGPMGRKWFPGDFDSLKSGQEVVVYLKQKKDAQKYVPRPKKDKELVDDNKPVISTVCILFEHIK